MEFESDESFDLITRQVEKHIDSAFSRECVPDSEIDLSSIKITEPLGDPKFLKPQGESGDQTLMLKMIELKVKLGTLASISESRAEDCVGIREDIRREYEIRRKCYLEILGMIN